ncbi:TPA: hypothetical protein N0F65_001875 [Lagenidium giganteum]|uniref:DDE Tnp4 domain-containing protein n=1 Tax=Lagenidium giganteum TaxID=4803 RepID=A0AAV2Z2L6_9STRA|nr:TPA: hypothetical protein N0F65_001875 [Lagenidium giganteum]
MMLTVLKHYDTCEQHASDFSKRTSTFEKLVGKMIDIVEPILFSHLIRPVSMKERRDRQMVFKYYPHALYATDRYFSGKHWQYGFKLECAVAYPGVAVHVSKHYPGSVHDTTIVLENLATHRKLLAKTDEDGAVADYRELALEYPDQHIMLVDKRYVGAPNHMRCIHPKKGSAATLSREDVALNQRISSDRVIVENYFGRVCSLWKVLAATYKWQEDRYDQVSRLCFALRIFTSSFGPCVSKTRPITNKFCLAMQA